MATLLLRLSGPMQSWGTQSRFRDRDTGLEPSKSGVIGLLCAALGRPRDADLADLSSLRLGVRADRPGVLRVDYHTAGGNYPKLNKAGHVVGRSHEAILSPRYYLSDAEFLVGLEGETEVMRHLDAAVAAPQWQIFLGRKAFPPGAPVHLPDGLRDEPLEQALREYPLSGRHAIPIDRLRLVLDATPEESNDVRMDVPLSFADRRYAGRRVKTQWMEAPQ